MSKIKSQPKSNAQASAITNLPSSALTDSQLVILSNAAAQPDGAANLPARLPKPAAQKVAASLIARKFMREVKAKTGMPVWRTDEDGRPIALVVTTAGRDAIGVEDEPTHKVEGGREAQSHDNEKPDSDGEHDAEAYAKDGPRSDPAGLQPAAAPTSPAINDPSGDAPSSRPVQPDLPRPTKQSRLIALLSREGGTTIDALTIELGWLGHTTRAALTGLRKKGFVIERSKAEGETVSVYRIVGTQAVPDASASPCLSHSAPASRSPSPSPSPSQAEPEAATSAFAA